MSREVNAEDFRAGIIAGMQDNVAHAKRSIAGHLKSLRKTLDDGATHELVHQGQVVRGRQFALESMEEGLAWAQSQDAATLLAAIREKCPPEDVEALWNPPAKEEDPDGP